MKKQSKQKKVKSMKRKERVKVVGIASASSRAANKKQQGVRAHHADHGHAMKATTYTAAASCHESHKPLKMGTGEILGASCLYPRDGYDVYIGFDSGMDKKAQQFPWEPVKENAPIEFLYKIVDMQAPSNPASFKLMIDWIAGQLNEGKKVHMGCIGGHGRTGVILAALHTVMTGDVDSIKWVRENYCKKAVESAVQVTFLEKHFGITKVEPSKGGGHTSYGSWSGANLGGGSYGGRNAIGGYAHSYGGVPATKTGDKVETFRHIKSKASIW